MNILSAATDSGGMTCRQFSAMIPTSIYIPTGKSDYAYRTEKENVRDEPWEISNSQGGAEPNTKVSMSQG